MSPFYLVPFGYVFANEHDGTNFYFQSTRSILRGNLCRSSFNKIVERVHRWSPESRLDDPNSRTRFSSFDSQSAGRRHKQRRNQIDSQNQVELDEKILG
jgi:hypothetical protein